MKKVIYILLIAGLTILFINLGTNIKQTAQSNKEIASKSVNKISEVQPDNITSPPKSELPQEIEIPKFGIKTKIESVGLDSQKRMDIPRNSNNTAWYNLGPRPGDIGSAVIAGHKDNRDGSPSVFWDIKNLKKNDEIIVTDLAGSKYTFVVKNIAEYPDASFPLEKVFNAPGEKSRLNLITCEGDWNSSSQNYSHRIVVFTELLSTNLTLNN